MEGVVQISFSNFVLGDAAQYKFSAPVELRTLVDDELFVELIQTEGFQRLSSVRFLGGIDYLLVRSPNGSPGAVRYTRLQHSLGVARLALMYSSKFELSTSERHLIVAAALLHDIGHAPLSHSIEPVLRERFSIDHHDATRAIIWGHEQNGRAVYKTISKHTVHVDRLVLLIGGKDPAFHSFFSGPINFDTIEGILRTRAFGKAPPAFPPDIVVDAAINRSSSIDQEIVDQFWSYKDQAYRHVINSSFGILADRVCQAFARLHFDNLSASDYFTTEDILFRKLPGLRQLLTSPNFISEAKNYLPDTIEYTGRRFLVDRTADFTSRNDFARYIQTRESMTLPLRELGNDYDL